jgi:Tfp pilus assembly protein PilO
MTNGQVDQTQQNIPQTPQEDTSKADEMIKQAAQETRDSKAPKKEKKQKQEVNLNMMAMKEALINYIVPIISLAVSALVGVLVLLPSYKAIPELSADLEEKTNLEITLKNKLSNMNRLLEFKNVVEENSELVSKVLVSEKLVPGLLTQIDKIARESGLSINTLNYGLGSSKAKDSKVKFDTVTVNLSATGSFTQLKSFMSNVENAARIIVVNTFRYSSQKGDDGANRVGVNFVLISPYLFVESNAVTDDPIDLDISDQEFQELINKIKGLKYYNPYDVDASVPVVETPEETEEEVTDEETLEGGGETQPTTEEETEESIFPTN